MSECLALNPALSLPNQASIYNNTSEESVGQITFYFNAYENDLTYSNNYTSI